MARVQVYAPGYLGRITGGQLIAPGNYEHTDPALHGAAARIVELGAGEWVDGKAPLADEPAPDDPSQAATKELAPLDRMYSELELEGLTVAQLKELAAGLHLGAPKTDVKAEWLKIVKGYFGYV